ncbi:hypothetical protein ACFL1B_04010 [Nanoarchaeota archaeon]
MTEMLIGAYTYLTKLHLIKLRRNLKLPYEYVRDDLDYIKIKGDNYEAKITQDGLILLRVHDDIENWHHWVTWLRNNITKALVAHNQEEQFFQDILLHKKNSIVILNPDKATEEIFDIFKREKDYEIETHKFKKTYGDGLAVFEKIHLHDEQRDKLLEYQIMLAEYQQLIGEVLKHNHSIWEEIASIRRQKNLKYKDLPRLIDELLEKKRVINTALRRIRQIDEIIDHREEVCPVKNELDELKMNDFTEFIRLNEYVKNQFTMTLNYTSGTIELLNFVHRENEQKELNILQVIFAIGTIAAIVSLGAMPGAKLFMTMTDNVITGNVMAFNTQDLVFWTLISICIGIFLFILLNYVFLHAKKFRVLWFLKKGNKK